MQVLLEVDQSLQELSHRLGQFYRVAQVLLQLAHAKQILQTPSLDSEGDSESTFDDLDVVGAGLHLGEL